MVKGVCLDLAGVLYEGNAAMPGAPEALARLRGAGLKVRFLTNTTRRPRRAILARLSGLGFEVASDELFTPARAAMAKLAETGAVPHFLIHPDLAEDFEAVPTGAGHRAVVVGDAGRNFSYENLNAAFRLFDGGADFLALAANRVFRDRDGLRSMDAGAFVAALEYASGRTAEVLGKPAPAFFAAALASMDVEAAAVMIGDDAEADVSGALEAGFAAGVLVRTGKYVEGDERRFSRRPTATVGDVGAAVDWILSR